MDTKAQIEALKKFSDGETVCPPELVGNAAALAEWSMDTLNALVNGLPLPNPQDYA